MCSFTCFCQAQAPPPLRTSVHVTVHRKWQMQVPDMPMFVRR